MAEFARLLRELKERTDRSYGSLARRLNMNTSTLHRYCAGDTVPVEFAPVERFAVLCGASRAERLDLHHRWLRAMETRQRPHTPPPAEHRSGTNPESSPAPDTGEAAHPSVPHPEPRSAPAPAPRPASRTVPRPGPSPDAGSGQDAEKAAHPSSPHAEPRSTPAPGSAPDLGSGPAPDTGEAAHPSIARAESPTGPDSGSGPDPDTRAAHASGPHAESPSAPDPWSSPDSGSDPGAGEGADACGPRAESRPDRGSAPDPESGPGSGQVARVGGSVGGRRPWYRRRKRVAVALAAACALLATVGSLSALPDDRGASAGSGPPDVSPGAPAASGSPEASRSRSASSSPSPSPSGSAAPKGGATTAGPRRGPATTAPAEDSATAAPPVLAWSADSHVWAYGCGHDYVVARPPEQVPPPPAPQDARTWAGTQSAVHGGGTTVQLSVQGTSETAVVLTALRVRVAGRADPAPGNAYAMDQGCGGALTPRYFDVDLDKDRPLARAVPGNDAGTPIPAVRMPYRVSATDPEVLLVTARTAHCDCRWYLELDWSSQGRTGTVRIDDDGRPFRTSGLTGLPRYEYDTSAREWRPRAG
ncbi:helix-turn-helix domain-containing protein [Streptomyces fungicidicus]|uniref:transcriptional regulator n=1 Tax=Streptomyces fungicidicus TaxID=68203 RepID=UPI00363255D6